MNSDYDRYRLTGYFLALQSYVWWRLAGFMNSMAQKSRPLFDGKTFGLGGDTLHTWRIENGRNCRRVRERDGTS